MTQSEIIFMVVAPHIHFCTQYHSGMLINNMALWYHNPSSIGKIQHNVINLKQQACIKHCLIKAGWRQTSIQQFVDDCECNPAYCCNE
jgi:hypothetical protein